MRDRLDEVDEEVDEDSLLGVFGFTEVWSSSMLWKLNLYLKLRFTWRLASPSGVCSFLRARLRVAWALKSRIFMYCNTMLNYSITEMCGE